MTATLLHPVLLTALESERSFPRSGQLGGMMALVLAIVVLGLLLG
ncbi:MAG TPA: hypothetical protein VK457_14600 [Chloroflexota bacterium]|jgi:hypothetical protein|nr:hypothetical protein [Chloroflexota bacterium]